MTELGLEEHEIHIKGVFRLNNSARSGPGTRPKLLKVVLSNSSEKVAILKNSKKLANLTNPNYKVYISPDMTKEERAHNTELVKELQVVRQECRDKNENCKVFIKHNKVVKIPNLGNIA